MNDKVFEHFNNITIQKFNQPMPLPANRNGGIYDPYGNQGVYDPYGNQAPIGVMPVAAAPQSYFRATLAFSGREDTVEENIAINKDYYANVYIQGNSIRELLDKCIEFCNENNVK